MLRVPVPSTLTTAGWRVYGLEAWISTSRTDIGAALGGHLDALGWIADRLLLTAPDEEAAPAVQRTPIDDARDALVQVDAIDSVDALAFAIKALANLSPEDLAQLREAESFRSAFQVTEEPAKIGLTTSWITWFERAVDPSFTTALDIARHGKDEWPIEFGAGDPAAVQAFMSALEKAQSDDLACERIVHALPFLVAWLQRDPDFPRAAMVPIYANLLTLFALGSAAPSRMAPIYARLSGLQRTGVAHLARELGWTLQSFGITCEQDGPEDITRRIQGLRIAIYSLTESSSRQAKVAIEELASTAVVDCNADHGGTARLRALAENADLFVVTWLSAKHAATDFIREHRGGRPLLYAQGRGFSSILRAVEDHVRRL